MWAINSRWNYNSEKDRSSLSTAGRENDLLKNPQRLLISSSTLEKLTLILSLVLYFCFGLVMQCTKTYQFIDHKPTNYFNNFAQYVINARQERDENPLSGYVAETMEPLGNSSCVK